MLIPLVETYPRTAELPLGSVPTCWLTACFSLSVSGREEGTVGFSRPFPLRVCVSRINTGLGYLQAYFMVTVIPWKRISLARVDCSFFPFPSSPFPASDLLPP